MKSKAPEMTVNKILNILDSIQVEDAFVEQLKQDGLLNTQTAQSKPLKRTKQYKTYPATNVGINPKTKTVEVMIAVPGFEMSELEIELLEDYLVVTGTKATITEHSDINFNQKDFSCSDFTRTILFGEDYVGTKKIEAQLKLGVLYISIKPNVKPPEPKQTIQIK